VGADASTHSLAKGDRLGALKIVLATTSAIRIGLVALWTGWWLLVALPIYWLSRKHGLPLALAGKVWAPGALWLIGARLEVVGAKRFDFSQSCLFVANHSSQADIPVVFAALDTPLRFLAKAELRRVPMVGAFIEAMGMVFIDRGSSEAARESIEQLAEALDGGMSLMAFPEGTRSADGTIQAFKTGAFVAAIKSGVPVVPVLIQGAAQVLPAKSLTVHPGPIRVVLGRAMPSRGLDLEDRRQFADRVRSELLRLSG
jgi:1-acyl-sn-glycerol-3-phosphate acyltransferase